MATTRKAQRKDSRKAQRKERKETRKERKETRKTRKERKVGGASAWNKHMMEVYRKMKRADPSVKLGDAMKAAKRTYKA
jgi:hypothetical protein